MTDLPIEARATLDADTELRDLRRTVTVTRGAIIVLATLALVSLGAVLSRDLAEAVSLVDYFRRSSPSFFRSPLPWTLTFGSFFVLALLTPRYQRAQRRAVFVDSELARARANPELAAQTKLQREAVAARVMLLHKQLASADRLSFVAFVVGLCLCAGAGLGPWYGRELVTAHPEHWQYILSGSALALVLLAGGTGLLRHQTRLKEQAQPMRRELHYFERIQTGLDCAQTLGDDRYREALAAIVGHLLAEPPALHYDAKSEVAGRAKDGASEGVELLVRTFINLATKSDVKSERSG